MVARTAGDTIDRLVQQCYVRLRRVMTVDATFFATVDPATLLFTSAYQDDLLTGSANQLLANELGGHDVNRFAELAAVPGHVRSLDDATRGNRAASERYREVMAPLGLGDELRAALVCDGWCWGVLCLHRARAGAGFGEREVRLVRRLAPHMARGLRRAMVVSRPVPAHSAPPAPGVVLVGSDGGVLSMTAAAEHWLGMLDDGEATTGGQLPAAVRAVAARHQRGPGSPPKEVRVRGRDGRWTTVSSSVLRGSDPPVTVVVLAPVPPHQLTSLLLAAHGLTPAQHRVTELVLRGCSTQEIVLELHLSEYTVQEYLRAAFDKVGVNSRRELLAALSQH